MTANNLSREGIKAPLCNSSLTSKRIWNAIVVLATLGGSIAHGEAPADLAVVYRWSNGTVAPKYFYRAEITIRSTGQSSFSVDLGTAPTAHRNLTLLFIPDAKLRDDLWNSIRSRHLDSHVGAADSAPGTARRTAPGGGECELTVLTHGDRVGVPCSQEAGGSLKTMIRAMVPASVEAQIDAAKADFAAGPSRVPQSTGP